VRPPPSLSSRSCSRALSDSQSFHRLETAQLAFRAALCDSFDTPTALQTLLDLVSQTNIYLARGRSSTNIRAVLAVSEYVTRMLRMFGLGEGSPVEGVAGERVVGWGAAPEPGQEDAGVDVRPALSRSLSPTLT